MAQHMFALTPRVTTQRSTFQRNHGVKTTFDEGLLIPIYVDEVLPGDTYNLRMTGFGRLATPIKPIMDNMYLDSFFFFVPSRLVWDNHSKFMGEQVDPGDSTDYLIPTVTAPAGGHLSQTMADYYGIPPRVEVDVNALPFRAYNLIWNEFFRDQNLQDSLDVPRTDGPDLSTLYTLQRRGKRHDYFTSCLPWPQKGPSIDIPLGTSAPVYGSGKSLGLTDGTNNLGMRANSTAAVLSYTGFYNKVPGYTGANGTNAGDGKALGVVTTGESGLVADLSTATAATINQLRQAFQVQKMYEKDARGGTRYVELVKSHFGVTSPDFRLQRPEYLGGGSSMINVNPIAQTSSTDATTPQGNLSAMGTVAVHGHGFSKSFTEHGYIVGLVSVRADLTYQQGLHKMWSRSTKLDFYWPSLAQIGEQAVLSKEIYCDGTAADEDVFGYQERYAEYRYKPSIITGKFRSTDPQPLDIWHLAQEFASRPALNEDFIAEHPPIDRVVAIVDEPHFLYDADMQLRTTRCMPLYSVPGNIDHF